MDSEEEVARREAQVEEENRALERLKRITLSEQDLDLLKNLTGSLVGDTNRISEQKPATASAVSNLAGFGVNIPPSSTESNFTLANAHARSQRYLADVLGDGAFVDDGAATEAETDSEFATDSEMAADEVDELSTKDLGTRMTLRDERCTEGRPVNAIRFHTKHQGILLSAHGKSRTKAEKSGVINIWELEGGEGKLQRTLLAYDSVTAMVLPSISPTSVYGATFGGELLMWDLRAKASTATQRAGAESADPHFGHSRSPVYCLEGAMGKGELISASANGTVCVWSASKLSSPLSSFSVRSDDLHTVRIAALGVPSGRKLMARDNKSSQYYFVGGEEGGIHRFEMREDSWTIGRSVAAHIASVTGIAVHPTSRKWPAVNDVVLSSSIDWSVKLTKMDAASSPSAMRKYHTATPGVVGDVQWNPSHPCIFAMGDEAGGVSLMDVEKSLQPSKKGSCRQSMSQHGGEKAQIVNRVEWSKDGCLLSAGDLGGGLDVWRCSEKVYDSSATHWERLSNFLKQLE